VFVHPGSMDAQETPRLILRPRDAAHFLGLSRPTLWRYVKAGHLPAPRRLGPNAVGWPQEELERWVASRPASTNPTGAA
jgi:prophage regulatory protein